MRSIEKQAKPLRSPLQLGGAIFDLLEAHFVDNEETGKRYVRGGGDQDFGHPTQDGERAEMEVRRTTERVNRQLDQIARLSTVDGAVVLSHKLDVLAFGAKLPTKRDLPEVFTLAGAGEQAKQPWPLEDRGTRHRAAAAFANEHPDRIAFIVSEDGHPATFQIIGGDLFYLPL